MSTEHTPGLVTAHGREIVGPDNGNCIIRRAMAHLLGIRSLRPTGTTGSDADNIEANARRIAACWNAAEEAGLSTEALEAGCVKAQREALESLVSCYDAHGHVEPGNLGWNKARAALDKAKKGE